MIDSPAVRSALTGGPMCTVDAPTAASMRLRIAEVRSAMASALMPHPPGCPTLEGPAGVEHPELVELALGRGNDVAHPDGVVVHRGREGGVEGDLLDGAAGQLEPTPEEAEVDVVDQRGTLRERLPPDDLARRGIRQSTRNRAGGRHRRCSASGSS